MSGPSDSTIRDARSAAALERAGALPGDAEGKPITVQQGGHTYTQIHVKRGTLLGAGRAAGRAAATAGAAVATFGLALAAGPAYLVGGKRGLNTVTGAGKSMWRGVNKITEKGDAGRLGRTAIRGLGVLLTGGTALFSKQVREGMVSESAMLRTEATFDETRALAKEQQKAADAAGYDERDAKSVARFLNAMKEKGQTFTENGHLIYVDEKTRSFLFAEMSADGRAVPHTARCMAVTRRSYSKEEKVAVTEVYRYAKAYAYCYDELKEQGSAAIDKMSEKELFASAATFLQKLDSTKENIKTRKLLVEYLSHSGLQGDDGTKMAKFKRIQRYVHRAGMDLGGDEARAHPNDPQIERSLYQALRDGGGGQLQVFTTDQADYLERHQLGATPTTESLVEHLEAQDFRRKQIKDHLQKCIFEDTGIAYTELGQANDTQRAAVQAGLDDKLSRIAEKLYPDGGADLGQVYNLAKKQQVDRAYLEREGLLKADGQRDEAKIEAHLDRYRERFQCESNEELGRRLMRETADANEIFKAAGMHNIQVQRLLLAALTGQPLAATDNARITEYLKREGVVPESFTGAIEHFLTDPAINKAALDAHIDRLLDRYNIGQEREQLLQRHGQVATLMLGITDQNQLKNVIVTAAQNAPMRNYLASHGIVPKEGSLTANKVNLRAMKMLWSQLVERYNVQADQTPAAAQEMRGTIQAQLQAIIALGTNPYTRLTAKLQKLGTDGNFKAGAITAKQRAKETAGDLSLMSDIWDITHGAKAPADFSSARLQRMTNFLRAEGAKIESTDDWYSLDWKKEAADDAEFDRRDSISETLNRALEEKARVVNTGGDNASQHVKKALSDRLQELKDFAGGKGALDIQIAEHKRNLKETPPQRVCINAKDGKVRLTKELKYDEYGKEKEPHTVDVTVSMEKGTKESVHQLWTDVNSKRPLVPEFDPRREKKKSRAGR